MFSDRRHTADRRRRHDPSGIPAEGCRRRQNRRDRARGYQSTPWWLQAAYAEEVELPVLLDIEYPATSDKEPPE